MPGLLFVLGLTSGGDKVLAASGDISPLGDVGAGAAVGDLQPMDQSESSLMMSPCSRSLAISNGD